MDMITQKDLEEFKTESRIEREDEKTRKEKYSERWGEFMSRSKSNAIERALIHQEGWTDAILKSANNFLTFEVNKYLKF